MEIRLQKFLAEAGVASRRKSEEYITQGLVTVNGKVVTELGTKIDENNDIIKYNNQIIKINQSLVYYLLHKPVGYVTTVKDEQNRKTVLDLIKSKERIFPVGRLDLNSSGLLIMTNDGDLTYQLTHPKHNVSKTYKVKIKGKPSENGLNMLRKGLDIGVYKTSKCIIENYKYLPREDITLLKVVLFEGKNRQIRRMFEYIGNQVVALKRTAIGDIELGDLKTGQYRELTIKEIEYLKEL